MFSHRRKHPNPSMGLSNLEVLEPRLLLTTIQFAPVPVDDPNNPGLKIMFDYYKDVTKYPPDVYLKLEKEAWNATTNHVVEFYYKDFKSSNFICLRMWRDEAPTSADDTMPAIEIMQAVAKPADGVSYMADVPGLLWNLYQMGNPTLLDGENTIPIAGGLPGMDPLNPVLPTQIYMIYVQHADSHTHITFDTCPIEIVAGSQGSGAKVTIHRKEAKYYGNSTALTANIPSPGGSGSILIGASFGDATVASSRTTDQSDPANPDQPLNANSLGLFPGGNVHAGIMMADNQDIGQLLLPGTLAGRSDFTGSVQDLAVGFLWGQVNVADDVGQLSVKTDFGWDENNTPLPPYPNSLLVNVSGSIRAMDVQGGFYGSLRVGGAPNTPVSPANGGVLDNIQDNVISEMEDHDDSNRDTTIISNDFLAAYPEGLTSQRDDANAFANTWALHNDMNNDTPAAAQYLSSETGTFTVSGRIQGDKTFSDDVDWYAVSLMAGDTINLQLDPNSQNTLWCEFFDSHYNNVVPGAVAKAGIYYIAISNSSKFTAGGDANGTATVPTFSSDALPHSYTLTVTTGRGLEAGALRVHKLVSGNEIYGPRPEGAPNVHIDLASGDFGAIDVTGSIKEAISVDDGALIELRGASYLAPTTGTWSGLTVSGGIGIIDVGNIDGPVIVGNEQNNNASIGTIYTGWLSHDISVTGGIGAIIVDKIAGVKHAGDLGFFDDAEKAIGFITITINSDDAGPYAYCDQIQVASNFAGLLVRGAQADYRYLTVDGTIWDMNEFGTPSSDPNGKLIAPGAVTTIADDAGGEMTITPGVHLDMTTGTIPRINRVLTGGAYWAVPTYRLNGMRGNGVVVARLDLDGPASIYMAKPGTADYNAMAIGKLTADFTAGKTWGDITISGLGSLDVAYVKATGIRALSNTAGGDLASGDFKFQDTPPSASTGTGTTPVVTIKPFSGISWAGNIGSLTTHYKGAVVWGHEKTAPHADAMMGFINRRINGLWLGDSGADSIIAYGHIGDIYSPTGPIGTLAAGTDNQWQDPKYFDGIVGVTQALSYKLINVGDGVAVPGGGWAGWGRAMAGVYAENSIGTVTVSGYGRDIMGLIVARYDTSTLVNGKTVRVPSIAQITGSNGAILSGIIMSYDFHQPTGIALTGGIGNVDFTGAHSVIDSADLEAISIGRVTASNETDGINNSYFHTQGAPVNVLGIGLVSAGGPGLNGNTFYALAGGIGAIRATNNGDLVGNKVTVSDGNLGEFSGWDITQNTLNVSNTLTKIIARGDVSDNINVRMGTLGTMNVTGSFMGNDFQVSARITSVTIGGNFQYSNLAAIGISTGYIGSVSVVGNISGSISSTGSIGTIASTKGTVSADISAASNITSISGNQGVSSIITVDGNVGTISSGGAIGVNPASLSDYVPMHIDIDGNLTTLKITTPKGQPADLFSTLNIGGNVGTITVSGMLAANLFINGDLGSLSLGGDLGGMFDLGGAAGVMLGNVNVMGKLKTISLPGSASIVADLTIGGDIGAITLNDPTADPNSGNITGNVTSLHGMITGITLTNGRIDGDIAGDRGIGKIALKGTAPNPSKGTLGDSADIAGNVSSDHGSVGTITVSQGLVTGSITGWGMTSLTVTNGDMTGALNIDGDSGKISVSGTVGADIWINGQLAGLSAGSLNSANVGVLTGIPTITVAHDVYDSSIIGGYGSDTDYHSAAIGTMSVGGNWDSSLLAVGVMPGAGGDFRASTDPVPGLSTLTKLTVKGSLLENVATNLVEANTSYGSVPAGMPATLVRSGEPTPGPTATQLHTGENDFPDGLIVKFNGPGAAWYDAIAQQLILNNTTKNTTVVITNADSTNPITFSVEAGDDDQLMTLSAGAGVVLADVDLDGGAATITAGDVEAGSVWNLPGVVSKLTTNGMVDVDMTLGSLGTYTVNGDLTGSNGQITVDKLTSMVVNGKMAVPVTATLGGIGSLTTNGNASKGVSGDLLGDVTARGPINTVTVNIGNFSNAQAENAVRSLHDSIGTFSVKGGNAWGLISANTKITTINVTASPLKNGTGTVNLGVLSSRVLARGSIGTVSADMLTNGLISTLGSIGTVTVRGDMRSSDIVAGLDTGDAGPGGDDSESNAFDARSGPGFDTGAYQDVFGGGSITLVKVGGDMASSSVAAGVSPGLDGYFGTADDQTHGTGAITKVTVTGTVEGSGYNSQSFAVTAANSTPKMSALSYSGNFCMGNLYTIGGSPDVTGVDVFANRLEIHFSHNIDAGTIMPSTLQVQYVDLNGDWQTLPADDFAVFQTPNMLSDWYDASSATLTLALSVGGQNTWDSLNAGQIFRVFISGGEQAGVPAVADQRGNALDGEFSFNWPSGDGQAGGDFYYGFVYGVPPEQGGKPTPINLIDPSTGGNLPDILPYNHTVTLQGTNPSSGTVYRFYAKTGDIVYTDGNAPVYWSTPDPSLSYFRAQKDPLIPLGHNGRSYVVTKNGPLTITVAAPGPFTIQLMVFNDGNGNVHYVDPAGGLTDLQDPPGQTPQTVAWNGNTAQIPASAEIVSTPDDADVFDLGHLAGGTTLNLSLDTYLIGSQLSPEMAVFNSNGDMIGNIIDNEGGSTIDITNISSSLTLSKSVYLPADDTYYVAVAGTWGGSVDTMSNWNVGKYDLSVSKTDSAPGPVFAPQWVYLNFSGGTANFLKNELGKFTQANLPGLTAPTFDLSPMDRKTIIDTVVAEIETIYSAYPNIHFVTDPTQIQGQYSTVYFTDATDPNMPGLEGIGEDIDTNNQIHNDSCVVFAGALVYDPAVVEGKAIGDVDKISHAVAIVGAHELGHILGLNHTIYGSDDIMGYDFVTDDMSFKDHTHLMTYAQTKSTDPQLNGYGNGELEFPIGYQNYTLSLASIA